MSQTPEFAATKSHNKRWLLALNFIELAKSE